jgi:hypothetical protein
MTVPARSRSALDAVSSTLLSDALVSGAGRVECLVLPHRYDHLDALVDLVGSTAQGGANRAENAENAVATKAGRRGGLRPSACARAVAGSGSRAGGAGAQPNDDA